MCLGPDIASPSPLPARTGDGVFAGSGRSASPERGKRQIVAGRQAAKWRVSANNGAVWNVISKMPEIAGFESLNVRFTRGTKQNAMLRTGYYPIGGNAAMNTILQLQDGRIDLTKSGKVLLFRTDAAGSKVAKSDLSTGFDPVSDGATVTLKMGFKIPAGSPTSSIYLADFESNNSSTGTNPGIRIQLRDGIIRVDRAKIGESTFWKADQDAPLQTDKWHSLKVVMVPGDAATGHVKVFLDGAVVVNQHGATRLTSEALAGFGLTATGGEIDRVQVGLTANANTGQGASVAVRNVTIGIEDGDRSNTSKLDLRETVNQADTIYKWNTEANPKTILADPDWSFFGKTIKGNAGDNVLKGGKFDDHLFGRAGDDLLRGNRGDDTLSGGDGADVFVFNDNGSNDVVTDFTPGVDRIRFDMSASEESRIDWIQKADGVLVHHGVTTMLLKGVSVTDVSTDDFFFF